MKRVTHKYFYKFLLIYSKMLTQKLIQEFYTREFRQVSLGLGLRLRIEKNLEQPHSWSSSTLKNPHQLVYQA